MESGTVFLALGLAVGTGLGFLIRRYLAAQQRNSVEADIKRKLEEAEARAKEITVEGKEKAAAFLAEAAREERERKKQLEGIEARLREREAVIDKRYAGLDDEEKKLKERSEALDCDREAVSKVREKALSRLEEISNLSKESAKSMLLEEVRTENSRELAECVQKFDQERRDEVEKRALEVITIALQRYARSHVAELTTTAFPIADEELKGKIIGREGRNIRALERATGVELVIDETPDSIVISSFDPYRREVARLALVKLIKDGRIQPAKIEEKVEEAKAELQKRVQEIGEAATMEVGVYDLPKEIVQLIGRLHFRTSYGQNVLMHSIEMTYISQMIAAELGLNVEVARKGALLHDIGKAIDHEVQGTHVELGRKILKKYGIDEKIIEAMQSHHEDYPYASPEAFVVTAADVLSAARPGARRDTVENYIKRLQDLERIAMEFPGVKQAYAISAGRELRIFVVPEKVDDFRALELARETANRIQSELKYPGEIKVNVIREMRAVEYAR